MNEQAATDQTSTVFRNVGDMLDTAQLHQRAGDLPKAEDLYLQVLQEDPTNADAHHLLGLIALQVGKGTIARELIQTAVELDDSQALYQSNLGATYYSEQEYAKAEEAFQKTLGLDPDFYDANLNLGIISKHQGKYNEAVQPLDKAVQLRQTDPKAFAHLADVLIQLERFDEAESIATAAANLGPRDSETMFALINAYEGLSRSREAIDWCQALIEREPANPIFQSKMAALCLEA